MIVLATDSKVMGSKTSQHDASRAKPLRVLRALLRKIIKSLQDFVIVSFTLYLPPSCQPHATNNICLLPTATAAEPQVTWMLKGSSSQIQLLRIIRGTGEINC